MSCIGAYRHDFYFVHGTWNMKNMIKILEDGKIKCGKDLDGKYLTMSSPQDTFDTIFGHIYFDDIKNLPDFMTIGFIIHPKIVCDRTIEYHEGWGMKCESIIEKDDPDDVKIKKLNKIRSSVKKLANIEDRLIPIIMRHEVLLGKQISVRKYIIGIVIDTRDTKVCNKIKKLIASHNYKIKLIDIRKMPTLKEILSS